MTRLKLPKDPRRRKQVKTFVEKHGRQKYAIAGSRGGRPSPASFTSETARAAALKGVAKRKAAKDAAEREKHEQPTKQKGISG